MGPDRAGTTTTVNVTIDSDAFSIDGTCAARLTASRRFRCVVYRAQARSACPIAVTQADVNGHYAFKDMPAGTYKIDTTLDSKDVASITGIAAAETTCTIAI